MIEAVDALVIGGGPAGVMAAETLASAGRSVVLTEAKPSLGRKFLMAGKSGLNLTKEEPFDRFCAAYGDAERWLRPMLEWLGPQEVVALSEALGQPVFTGSSGRVFPKVMKASPFLRAWLGRMQLDARPAWRWIGCDGSDWVFETREGHRAMRPRVVVLALGGASWARLGSDGQWAAHLEDRTVPIAPFRPANMGFRVSWSPHMKRHLGQPIKGAALRGGTGPWTRGEFVLSERGLEGGGIYAVSAEVRDGGDLWVDLCPDLNLEEVAARLGRRPKKRTVSQHLERVLKLSPAKRALLQEMAHPLPSEVRDLAGQIKSLLIRHDGPRPLDEAISTAGGVRREGLDEGLMLRDWPGVFCCGEMLDWEAPTGGYLLTGCFATGAWAGHHAAKWAASETP